MAAYLQARWCDFGQSRQKHVGVHRSVVLRGVPFWGTVFLQGALTFLSSYDRIPNPFVERRGGRKRDGEDRHTSRPYGGSLESLCTVRRDSVRRTGPTAGWNALNPFGSAGLFVREIRTTWIFHKFYFYMTIDNSGSCCQIWVWIVVNHGKNTERTDFFHACICDTYKELLN